MPMTDPAVPRMASAKVSESALLWKNMRTAMGIMMTPMTRIMTERVRRISLLGFLYCLAFAVSFWI